MSARRLATIALAASAASAGCATGRVGLFNRPEPIAAAPSVTMTPVAEVVSRYNRNAAQVQSLSATPTVSVSAATSRIAAMGGGASGMMVFERPQNFRFVVNRGMGRRVADIGSNDDEFWFWGDDKNDPNIYVCRYEDAADPAASKELAFQPDWIVEALGLREVTNAEAAQIKQTAGPRPNTVAWTHSRVTARGEPVRKVSIVDRTTGDVIEHQFYIPGSQKAIAVARPMGMKDVPLADDPDRTVRLPQKIHLELTPADPRGQTIAMDLAFSDLKVNSPISEERRAALFAIPKIAGSQVYTLGKPADAPRSAGRDRRRGEIRQSAPVPEPANGAKLGDPAPIDADQNYLRSTDPMPLGPDLGQGDGSADRVVGVPLPQAPETPIPRTTRRDSIPYPQ